MAARARRARAARRARRPVAPPRGPHAGAEHRHRGPRRQRLEPHRRPRRPARRGARRARGAARPARPDRRARGPDRPRRRPRRRRHAAPHRARRGDGRAAGRPHRRRDPRHRRPGARPGRARRLPRPGAGAADRQRRATGTAASSSRPRPPSPSSARRSASSSASRTSAPPAGNGFAPLAISLDGTEPLRFDVPLNRSVTLPVTLQRGGVNVLQIATPEVAGELTDRNNARHRLDQRRPRPAARAPGLRRALSGRAHLAEPAEVRLRRRPRPLHHPAPAREAGLRPGLRALADRLPDPGAVHGEGRRVRPDHLRPLQAPRHPAEPLFREHRPLCPRRRRAADRGRRRLRRRREPLPLAAARGAPGRADRAGHRGGLPPAALRGRAPPPGDRRPRGARAAPAASPTAPPAGAAGSAWSRSTRRTARR